MPGDGITNATSPAIVGTGANGDTVDLYNGATLIGAATVSGGAWSITPTSPLAAGSYSLTATETDVAGNVSAPSGAFSLTIDTAIPAAPSTPALAAGSDSGVPGDGITNATSPAIVGTGANGDTVDLYNGATLIGAATVSGGAWSITPTSPLAAGSYSLTATETDVAGNVSARPARSA